MKKEEGGIDLFKFLSIMGVIITICVTIVEVMTSDDKSPVSTEEWINTKRDVLDMKSDLSDIKTLIMKLRKD